MSGCRSARRRRKMVPTPEPCGTSILCSNCQKMLNTLISSIGDSFIRNARQKHKLDAETLTSNIDEYTVLRGSHHENAFELDRAATSECAICYQFWRSQNHDLESSRGDLLRLEGQGREAAAKLIFAIYFDPARPDHGPCDNPERRTLTLTLNYTQMPVWYIPFKIRMIPTDSVLVPLLGKTLEIGSTRHSLPTAKKWLNTCLATHCDCNGRVKNFIPTRLVSTDHSAPRVCELINVPGMIQYATLSHCWGTARFLTLLENNIGEFRNRIPEEALSQTIQDALQIARELNFSYLWIDTLCIIQDDPMDWQRESALMGNVYGGSGLNIAASGACDGNDGCFLPRPRHWRCQVQVPVAHKAQRYDVVPFSMYNNCLSTMPLLQRGWALQERMLATRTVHFTTTEVFWACHQSSACESFPDGLPYHCIDSPDYLAKRSLQDTTWSWIVERYSRCKLTYSEDKLVAISGLARQFQKFSQDQYVAGMWRDNLEFQLCWYTSNPAPRRRSSSYIAPSWSWASVDTVVDISIAERWKDSKESSFVWITIHDVQIRLSGSDIFGALIGASLYIRCSVLLRFHLQPNQEDQGRQTLCLGTENIQCQVFLDVPYNTPVDLLYDAYLLPVFGRYPQHHTTGLLLELAGQGRGVYRRIGWFRFWSKELAQRFVQCTASRIYRHQVDPDDCYEVRTDEYGRRSLIIQLI